MGGTLYIVGTPIGNLEDITFRAVRILKEVDLIAAEDTRTSGILLKHYNIDKPLTSYYEHNKLSKGNYLVTQLLAGKNIAVVSDAGTPCISDAGSALVEEASKNGIKVVAVPGPSAVVSALSVSGLQADRYIFLGFLKKKPSKRRKELEACKNEDKVIVFYESPHRIFKALEDVRTVMGEVLVVVNRELTKKFEETVRGTASEVINYFTSKKILGEFCVVVKPFEKDKAAAAEDEDDGECE
ncbi:MAG: 16S rRNA (cytidine(1402)-2'-O)-methyltransferase [Candidatus Firestonebacteria bacterium RIFOXYA2_FULL_40_8]|nr:MAG: 16S rRNA (cytidine(1402)-2'-O)-methyltransferase [Candidatus Firestonebacteria bacterium RIFOXYA2_FULL_40_8]